MTTFALRRPALQGSRIAIPGIAIVAIAIAAGLPHALDAQGAPPDGAVVSTSRFDLRSTPRASLFHFLLDWASADAGEWPPYAPPLAERDGWEEVLTANERGVWQAAVTTVSPARSRSLLFDEGMLAVRDWAAGAIAVDRIPSADRGLANAIESALPVYMAHWWSAHDSRNCRWVEAVAPELGAIEEEVIPRMAAAYGGQWPAGHVPVDVVPYANPVGAYSSGGRLTISSVDRDNGLPQALELVFHEASHTDSLEAPLTRGLEAAFRAAGGEAPDRFWHDVIFYTTGEIVKIVLERAGKPGYQHYGTGGVYSRGERWKVELPALRQTWAPFLQSGSADDRERRAAMEALAVAVLRGTSGNRGPGG